MRNHELSLAVGLFVLATAAMLGAGCASPLADPAPMTAPTTPATIVAATPAVAGTPALYPTPAPDQVAELTRAFELALKGHVEIRYPQGSVCRIELGGRLEYRLFVGDGMKKADEFRLEFYNGQLQGVEWLVYGLDGHGRGAPTYRMPVVAHRLRMLARGEGIPQDHL